MPYVRSHLAKMTIALSNAKSSYLFYVVGGNQADGFFLVFCAGLLLSFPPIILIALFEYVEQVSLGDLKLALRLRSVIVQSLVHAKERHRSDSSRSRQRQVGSVGKGLEWCLTMQEFGSSTAPGIVGRYARPTECAVLSRYALVERQGEPRGWSFPVADGSCRE